MLSIYNVIYIHDLGYTGCLLENENEISGLRQDFFPTSQ